MLNKDAHLADKVFADDIAKAPTRDGFGTGTVEAAKSDPRIVVLCADLTESTRAEWFEKEFPERFVEMGIAEQNMAATAAGMALAGKIPFIASYAAFNPGRNYEQIRTTIALNRVPVKVCGMHAGVSVGPDGATHQMLEDIGLMRMLPGMTVVAPADAEEARKAVVAAAKTDGPVYIRFGRSATPIFTTRDTPFEIGKAQILYKNEKEGEPGTNVGIIATGPLVYQALRAADSLAKGGIRATVVNLATIKPLDEDTILKVAKLSGRIVTVEEHQIAGGMGSAVAEFLAEQHPMPIRRLGIRDQFGQSGEPGQLWEHYGVDAHGIEKAVRAFVRAHVS